MVCKTSFSSTFPYQIEKFSALTQQTVPFIYFSFFLIMIGTILSLIPSKQIWVFMSDDSKKIYFGGLINKNLSGFRDEFLKIQSEIRDY